MPRSCALGCCSPGQQPDIGQVQVVVEEPAPPSRSASHEVSLGKGIKVGTLLGTLGETGSASISELKARLANLSIQPGDVTQLLSKLKPNLNGLISEPELLKGLYNSLPVLTGMVRGIDSRQFAHLSPEVFPSMPTHSRGTTIKQLRALYAHIERHCVSDGWKDIKGARLTPETVCVYDVVRYVIKPATHARRCSSVSSRPPAPRRSSRFGL